MYCRRLCLLCLGCLLSDAVGTATLAPCEHLSKQCSKPLSTKGVGEDEASLLQADLKMNSKMDVEEDYTPSKDEKSKYHRSWGERAHDEKYNDESRVERYTGAKHEKSKYKNYLDKKKTKYDRIHGKKTHHNEVKYGQDYNVKTSDYAPTKEIKSKHKGYYAKHAKPWRIWPKWKQDFARKGRIAKHRNLRTLHAWMQVAQAIPVDAHEYCSFYAPHSTITAGPDSTPITKHDCESRIADLFSHNTQRFKNVALTWIKPNAVIARFDMFWCTLPCAGRGVVCGKHPVRDTAVLFRFNKASHIHYQEWFYDTELLPELTC